MKDFFFFSILLSIRLASNIHIKDHYFETAKDYKKGHFFYSKVEFCFP